MTTQNTPGQGQYPYPYQPNYGGQPPHWGPPPSPAPGMPGGQPQPPKKGGKAKWIVAGVIALLIVIGLANGGNDDATQSPAAPVAAPAAPAPVPAQVPAQVPAASGGSAGSPAEAPYNGYGKTEAKYGQQIEAGDMTVTAEAPKTISQQFLGDQVCSKVTYRNTGDSPEQFSMFDWKFRTASGVQTNASIPFNAGDNALNTGQLAPGGTTSGQVCGDQQTKNVTSVVYSPGFGVMHEVTFTK